MELNVPHLSTFGLIEENFPMIVAKSRKVSSMKCIAFNYITETQRYFIKSFSSFIEPTGRRKILIITNDYIYYLQSIETTTTRININTY